jgi:hypothetical protein
MVQENPIVVESFDRRVMKPYLISPGRGFHETMMIP